MQELRAWIIVTGRLLHYIPYKMGLRELPGLYDIFPETMAVLGRILGWHKYLHLRGAEHCPRQGPAVFASNHMKMDDAWIMFRAIYLAGGRIARFMMRDDFFRKAPIPRRILDLNELTAMGGTYHVSRDHVTLAQLKPFVEILTQGESFIMYPGRTRSRTGFFFEYRDGVEEPGGVSFFVAQAQRRRPDAQVAVVPVARTFNPVNFRSTLAFGAPLYLDPNADRAAQRALDYRLMEHIGDLLEVNVAHLLAGILYLRCLHGFDPVIQTPALAEAVARARDAIHNRYIDPFAHSALDAELQHALKFLEKRRMLRRRGTALTLDREAILSAPPHDKTYKDRNAVKFLANPIIHLPGVVAAIEQGAEVS